MIFTPNNRGNLEGQLTFETGGKPVHVELRGEGLQTFLVSPAKLNLKPSPDGKRAGSISVQNHFPEPVTIELESNFDLPKTISLQFGEARELSIIDGGISALTSQIVLKNGTETQRVEVTAREVVSQAEKNPPQLHTVSPQTIKPVAVRPTPPAVVSTTPTPTPPTTEPDPTPTPVARVPQTIRAKLSRVTIDSVRVDWSDPSSAGPHAIEQRYLIFDEKNQLNTQWVPVPSAKLTESGHTGSANIDDLDLDTVFTFRVVQTGGDPAARLVSQPLPHRTEPHFFRRIRWRSFLFPTALILLALVAWKRWRKTTRS